VKGETVLRTSQPSATGGLGYVAGLSLGCLMAGLCVVALLVGFVVPMARAFKTLQRPTADGLHALAIALQNYHDTYGAFPPAVVTDSAGQPLYSGRVLLLPFLGEQLVYDQFDKEEAWDSPRNSSLSFTSLVVFHDPACSAHRPGQTDFLFVTGQNTIFEEGAAVALRNVSDGPSNTITVVDVAASGISWAEPQDLDLSKPGPLPPGNSAGGNYAVFADGSVRFLRSASLTPQQIRGLATRSGGEPKSDF